MATAGTSRKRTRNGDLKQESDQPDDAQRTAVSTIAFFKMLPDAEVHRIVSQKLNEFLFVCHSYNLIVRKQIWVPRFRNMIAIQTQLCLLPGFRSLSVSPFSPMVSHSCAPLVPFCRPGWVRSEMYLDKVRFAFVCTLPLPPARLDWSGTAPSCHGCHPRVSILRQRSLAVSQAAVGLFWSIANKSFSFRQH